MPRGVPKHGGKKRAPRKGKKDGAPIGLTPQRLKVLVRAIGHGLPKVKAADLAKCSYDSVKNWLQWGEEAWAAAGEDWKAVSKQRLLHVKFFLDSRAAVAETVDNAIAAIEAAAPKNWQASAWLAGKLCQKFSDQRKEMRELKELCNNLVGQLRDLEKSRVPDAPPDPGKGADPIPLPAHDLPKSEPDGKVEAGS